METENKKAVHVGLAVICLLTWFIVERGLAELSNMIGVRNFRLLDTVPASAAIGFVLAAALFVVLVKNNTVMNFSIEVVGELKKVVWPNRQETGMSTVVVVVLVFITAVILWFYDWVWSSLMRLLIS